MRVQFLRYMGEDREYIDKIQRETGVSVGEAAAVQLMRELQEKKITGMIEPDTYLFAGDTYLIEGTIEADGATLQKAYDDGVAGEWQMISVPTAANQETPEEHAAKLLRLETESALRNRCSYCGATDHLAVECHWRNYPK